MSKSLTAINGTAGVTYTDGLGNPYRCDFDGIVHVPTTQVSNMTARFTALATATAANLTTARHRGDALVFTGENT